MTYNSKSFNIKRDQWIDFFIIPLLIFIFWFIFFGASGLLTSGFRFFINDHLMAQMYHDLKGKNIFQIVQVIKDWIVFDRSIGRFQPFYYVQAIILTKLIGVKAVLWFSNACLLTSLMSCFLFWFARCLSTPRLIALLFPAIALIGPQAATWAQPSHPQVIGMFLFSASLLFAAINTQASKYKAALNIVFLILTCLASLSKESFIICIPALVAIKVWINCRYNKVLFYQSVVQQLIPIVILSSIALLEIIYIIFSIGVDGMGYAGIDNNTFRAANVLTALKTLLERSHFEIFVLSIVFSLIVVLLRKQSLSGFFQSLWPPFLIFLLITVPQVVLYTKSGIDGIYLVPAIVGCAFLISQSLFLLERYSKLLRNILIGFTIFLLYSQAQLSWNIYNQISSDSRYMNSLLEDIQACTPHNEPVLIVVNPRVHYEASIAIKTVLNFVFQRDNLVVATYGLEKTNFFSDSLQTIEKFWAFLDPQSIPEAYKNNTILNFRQKEDIAAVVIFGNLENDFLKTSSNWFNSKEYQSADFPISYTSAKLYCRKQ